MIFSAIPGDENLVPMSLFFAVLSFVLLGISLGIVFFSASDPTNTTPRHRRFFGISPCAICGHLRSAHRRYSVYGRGRLGHPIEFCTSLLDTETNTVCNCPGYTDERSTS